MGTTPLPCYRFPALDRTDRSWSEALDSLRPPRPKDQTVAEWRRSATLRPVVFNDPGSMDGQVVHLHLEQRVVRRLLGRLLAQGFVHDDLARACVLPSDDAVRRVVLLGRLSLFGAGAARLHDELVAVTARWTAPADQRTEPLSPYAAETHDTTLERLEQALLHPEEGTVGDHFRELLARSTPTDVAELLPHLTRRALTAAEVATTMLYRRGETEAREMVDLLTSQRTRIEKQLEGSVRPSTARQLAFTEGFDPDERRQLDADRKHWQRRLKGIDGEIQGEPARIREAYVVQAQRIEPVGVIYLAPRAG